MLGNNAKIDRFRETKFAHDIHKTRFGYFLTCALIAAATARFRARRAISAQAHMCVCVCVCVFRGATAHTNILARRHTARTFAGLDKIAWAETADPGLPVETCKSPVSLLESV